MTNFIVYDEHEGLIKALPMQIKLEILKEDLLDIYELERKFEQIKQEEEKENPYIPLIYNEKIRSYTKELNEKYTSLSKLLIIFELDETSKMDLYIFCKQKRKDLGLSDNLFNISKMFIHKNYDLLNKKINNKKML